MSEPSSIWEGLLFSFALAGGCIALAFLVAVAVALLDRWFNR